MATFLEQAAAKVKKQAEEEKKKQESAKKSVNAYIDNAVKNMSQSNKDYGKSTAAEKSASSTTNNNKSSTKSTSTSSNKNKNTNNAGSSKKPSVIDTILKTGEKANNSKSTSGLLSGLASGAKTVRSATSDVQSNIYAINTIANVTGKEPDDETIKKLRSQQKGFSSYAAENGEVPDPSVLYQMLPDETKNSWLKQGTSNAMKNLLSSDYAKKYVNANWNKDWENLDTERAQAEENKANAERLMGAKDLLQSQARDKITSETIKRNNYTVYDKMLERPEDYNDHPEEYDRELYDGYHRNGSYDRIMGGYNRQAKLDMWEEIRNLWNDIDSGAVKDLYETEQGITMASPDDYVAQTQSEHWGNQLKKIESREKARDKYNSLIDQYGYEQATPVTSVPVENSSSGIQSNTILQRGNVYPGLLERPEDYNDHPEEYDRELYDAYHGEGQYDTIAGGYNRQAKLDMWEEIRNLWHDIDNGAVKNIYENGLGTNNTQKTTGNIPEVNERTKVRGDYNPEYDKGGFGYTSMADIERGVQTNDVHRIYSFLGGGKEYQAWKGMIDDANKSASYVPFANKSANGEDTIPITSEYSYAALMTNGENGSVDEVGIFMGLYNKAMEEGREPTEAKAFLDGLQQELRTRYSIFEDIKVEETAKLLPVSSSIASQMMKLTSSYLDIPRHIAHIFGDSSTEDPTSWWYITSDQSELIEKTISDELGGVAGKTYLNFMNSASNMLRALTVPQASGSKLAQSVLSLGSFFLQVDQESTARHLKDGMGYTEASTAGALDGVFEVFEELLPFETMLGTEGVNLGLSLLLNAVTEAGQEFVGGTVFEKIKGIITGEDEERNRVNQIINDGYYVNDAGEKIALSEDNETAINEARGIAAKEFWQNAIESGLGGAFGGGFSGFYGTVANAIGTNRYDRKTGERIIESGVEKTDDANVRTEKENSNISKLVEIGVGFRNGTQTKNIADRIQADLQAGKTAKKSDIGKLARSIIGESSERVADVSNIILGDVFKTELQESGVKNPDKISDALVRMIAQGDFSRDTLMQVFGNKAALKIVQEYQMGKFNPQVENIKEQTAAERAASKSVMEMLPQANDADVTADAVKKIVAGATVAATEDIRNAEGARTGNKGETVSEGKIADIAGIALKKVDVEVEGEDGKPKTVQQPRWQITMSDGREVDIANVKATDQDVAETLAFLQNDSGQVVGQHLADAVMKIATTKKTGKSSGDMATTLSNAVRVMWAAATEQATPKISGMSAEDAAAITDAVKADLEESEKKRLSGFTVLAPGKGVTTLNGVAYGSNAFNEALNKLIRDNNLGKNIKTEAQVIGTIAKSVGAQVELYYDANDTTNQGMFTAGGGIRINLAGTTNTAGAHRSALATFAHEVTHNIEANSPDAYRALRSFVFSSLGGKLNIQNELSRIQAMYSHYNVNLDIAGAVSELVAKACETVLTDESVIRQLQEQDADLAGTVGDAVTELVGRVQSIKGDALTSASMYARAMGDVSRGLSKAWMGAYREAAGAKGTTTAAGSSGYSFAGTDPETGRSVYISDYKAGTPSSVKTQALIDTVQNLWSKKPITLQITENGKKRTIQANFDPDYDATGARKTDLGKMTHPEFGPASRRRVALNLSGDYYQILEESEYDQSKPEEKDHPGVNQWHYFVDDIYYAEQGEDEATPYRIAINIKEKDDGSFVYAYYPQKLENEQTKKLSVMGIKPVNTRVMSGESASASNRSITQGARKNNSQNSISDEAYMDAVRAGDLKEAQRIVDEKAKESGYTINAYHGSPQENITQFDINNLGANTGSRDVPGFFFTNRRRAAEAYLHETNEVKPEYRDKYEQALETYEKYHYSFDRLNGWFPIGSSYGEYVKKTRPEKFKGFYDPESVEYKEYEQACKFLNNIDEDELLTKPKYTVRKRTGRVYNTYLAMKNPYVYDAEGSSWVPDFWPKVMAAARSAGNFSYNGGSFDGIIVKDFYDFDAGEMADVYVVFEPNQIKFADPITYDDNGNVIPLSERFTDNKDIRYSISENELINEYNQGIADGNMEQMQQAVEGYAASKGYTIRAYHGTGRADRVGTVFRADRATSGPMAFFTDSRDIAENYSRDKRDTSIAYDEEYGDYYNQFRIKTKDGKTVPVGKLWNTLSFAERQKITEKAKHITLDDDAEEIIYDENQQNGIGNFTDYERKLHGWNSIDTLIDGWLEGGTLLDREGDFLKVLELTGIKDVIWMNPDYREEKVYDVFLKIQNPFDTDTMYNEEFLKDLSAWWEKQDQSKFTKESMGADFWDKNNISVDEWIEHGYWDMENGATNNWTRIPDGVTAYLQSKKYDGIKDKGGKGGGAGHTVWIPFASEQIKSAETVTYDNKGKIIPLSERFRTDHKENWKNTDIRYSIQEREETYKALNIEPEVMFIGTMEQIDAAEKAEADRAEDFRKLIERNEFMALEFVKPDGRSEILHASTRPGIRYQLSYIGSDGQPTMHQNYGLLDRKAAGDVNVYSMDELYRHFVNENLRNDITFNVLEDNNEPKSAKAAENMVRERENINKISEKKANNILKKNGEIAYAPAQYSFAGEAAEGKYGEDVREAFRMEKEGATDEEIREKTNCIRGFNGRWWRIIDNNNMKLIVNFDEINIGKPQKLRAIYEADELYKAYPLLEYIPVIFKKMNKDIIGKVSSDMLHTIYINTDYLFIGKEGIESTLQHEIQHLIQAAEFSNRGANPTFWSNMQDMARARIANNDRQINELYSKYGIDAENELAWGIDFNEDGTIDEEWLFPEELEKVKKMSQEELELYKALDKDNQKWVKLLQGNKSPTTLYLNTIGEIEARAAEEKTDENTRIIYPDGAIAREEYTEELTSKPGASLIEKDDIEHLFGTKKNDSKYSIQDEMDYDVQSWMETVPEWSLKTEAEKTLLQDFKSLRMKMQLDRERESQTLADIKKLEELLAGPTEGSVTRPETMENALEAAGVEIRPADPKKVLSNPTLIKNGKIIGFIYGNDRVRISNKADPAIFEEMGFAVDIKTKMATYVNPEGNQMGNTATKKKLEALKVKLQNIRNSLEKTRVKLAEITSGEGFGGMMYRQQQVLNDLLYNKTQGEVQDSVERMQKRADAVARTIEQNQKTIAEMEKGGIVQKLKEILGTTTAEQAVRELKQMTNSTWTRNEITPLFNEIVLKMTQGQDYQQDIENLAGILVNSSKDNAALDEDLSALRGMTLIISEGQLKELRGQGSSLKEIRQRLAGTGITVKTGEYSSLTDNLDDTIAEYGPALFQDLGDEKDALENFVTRVEQRRNDAIISNQYAERLADTMAQIAAKAAGVAQGIYMPSDRTAQKQVLAMIEFVKGLAAQTEQAQKTLQGIADDMAAIQKEGRQASGMAGALARDVNVALDYYSRINQVAQQSARNQRQQAIIEQLKSKQAEKILKNNEEWRQLIARDAQARKQTEENAKTRGKINTVVKRMYNLLKNPKGTTNIPESMQGIARTVLESIVGNDMGGLKLTRVAAKDLAEISRVLRAWTERDGAPAMPTAGETSDDASLEIIEQDVQKIRDGISQYNADIRGDNKVDTLKKRGEILKGIQEALSEIYTRIRTENEVFVRGRQVQVANAAHDVVEGTEGKNYRELTGFFGRKLAALHKMIVSGNMTPEYFFRTLSNNGLTALWDNYHDAENRNGLELAKSKARMEEIADRYGYSNWDMKNRQTVKLASGDVQMTLGQIMSLWATWNREQQLGPEMSSHLTSGGFYTEEQDLRDGLLGRTAVQKKAHRVTEEDMAAIERMLTQEQKNFVNAVVRYMSQDMSELGNEASMAAYGIKMYKEGYYFPMQMWDGIKSRKSNDAAQGASIDRAFHPSFSKSRTHGANNALVIGDFMQVATDHIAGMINYATMGLANESLQKVLNYTLTEGENAEEATKRNVRARLEEAYGQEAMQYLLKLQEQLNGGAVRIEKTIYDKLISTFRKNAVAGSLSVALQQPMSYVRAAMLINPKYLAAALSPTNWKGSYKEMMQYSGVAVIKDMGRFDMNAGQSAREYLMPDGKESTGRKAWNKFQEGVTILPELMDRMTWTRMWSAVKAEQKAQHPDMSATSEEFLQMCGERFNDVMRRTQVYDSVLVKSANMRNQNPVMKSITSFMAEPTLTLNVLADAVRAAKTGETGGKGLLVKAGATFMLSAVLQAAIKGLMGSGRNPDDKKTWEENFLYRFFSSFISEADPLQLIPGFSDLITILKDGKLEDDAMSTIGKFMTAYNKTMDVIGGQNSKGWYRDLEDSAGQLIQLFSNVPMKNLMRDGRAMYNWVTQPYADRETSGNVIGNQTMELVMNADNFVGVVNKWLGDAGYKTDNATYKKRVYEAMRDGDESAAQNYIDYLLNGKGVKSEKSIMTGENGVTSYVMDDYQAGKITRTKADELLKIANPNMKDQDRAKKLDEVDYEAKTGEEAENFSLYTPLYDAMDQGNTSEIEAQKKHLAEVGVKESTISKNIKTHIRNQYEEGAITRKQAEEQYKKYAPGISEKDLAETLDEIDYEKETGTDVEGYSLYTRIYGAIDKGDAATIKSQKSYLKTLGIEEKSANSQIASYISSQYKEGKMKKSDAESKLKNYAGKDENDIFWTLDRIDYTKQTGKKVDSTEKYYRLYDAMDANKSADIQSAVKTITSHGTYESDVKKTINGHYKQLYLNGSESQKVAIQDAMQKAYKALGYTEKTANKTISNWKKGK